MTANAQSYSSLWRQVKDAQEQDLPKSAIQVLQHIEQKARLENSYGQLLAAQLTEVSTWSQLSPDSLLPQVNRLETEAKNTNDFALKAIYNTVLGTVYRDNTSLSDSAKAISQRYFDMAMQQPNELAKLKATAYEPLVVTGEDSRYFEHDLLSLIGRHTQRYDLMHAYYEKVGNSRATMLSALAMLKQQRPQRQERMDKSKYLRQLDSLANKYERLDETGEVAIELYQYLDAQTTATAEQKVQYINMALNRWGSWKRMNILRQAYQGLTAVHFNANLGQEMQLPDKPVTLYVDEMRGVNNLQVKVYSTQLNGSTLLNPGNASDFRRIKAGMTLLEYMTETRQYHGKQPWQTYKDTIQLKPLPVGVYLVEITSQPATDNAVRQLMFVTNLITLRHAMPDGTLRFAVVNATTGQPVAKAKIDLSLPRGKRELLTTLTTDKNGEATYKPVRRQYIEAWAYTDTDRSMQPQGAYGNFYNPKQQQTSQHVQLFTDRAIYRPGQQVNVAAVCYNNTDGINNQASAGKKITLRLRDANWQIVGEQEVTTDHYGTCATVFTLPQQTLAGHFTIQTDGGSIGIRVEEYKRPTFQISLPKVNQRYEAGDTIVLNGDARSYSGVPVGSAKVSYTIVRRPALWWWWNSRSQTEEIHADETVTDADGKFSIEMPLILPDEALDTDGNPSRQALFYNYVARVSVTDAAGESHQAETVVPLGTRKTAFSCDIPQQVLADNLKTLTFHLRNAAGQDIDADVRWQIDNGDIQTCKTREADNIELRKGRMLSSGQHTLRAWCEQDTLEQTFVVFALDDKKPATETHDWFYQQAEQWADSRTPITIQAGSSDKDVYMLYNIICGDRLLESGHKSLSDALYNRSFKYKDEYGNGLLLTYAWVKDGKVYHHEAQLRRPLPDKRLTLTWKTFRDRLTPGQQETWTLSVKPNDSTQNVRPQLLTAMYDKSLDQLLKHQWALMPYLSVPLPSTSWLFSSPQNIHFFGYKGQKSLQWSELNFSHIDEDMLPRSFMSRRGGWMALGSAPRNQMRMAKQADVVMSAKAVTNDAAMEESMAMATEDALEGHIGSLDIVETIEEGNALQDIQIRENLQETAFFYPQLLCDSTTGQVDISFRLPESLTTWHLMAVAHTPDMFYGQTEADIVAQKELMITPNVPRFLRHGDVATLAARITNMTQQAVNATATLQLLDPETERVLHQQRQKLSIKGDTTVAVSWTIKELPADHQLVIVRMGVDAGKVSDGEQHYLPLLPQSERVTSTLPFLLTTEGTHQIDISSILPTTPVSTQVEYTPSPSWLVMQALPTMAVPENDNVISQAASLYANMLGQHICLTTPGMKKAVSLWQQQTGSETALTSQLEKNQQLRDVLLQETPWVMDAKNETEQRHQLTLFFDDNTMQMRCTQALDRLEKLQLSDGAWSWWKGMTGSYWMTVEVSKMLVRLSAMNAADKQSPDYASRIDVMLQKASKYLGHETIELVKRMKADEHKGRRQAFPGLTALEWLYICSLSNDSFIDSEATKANSYLINLLKKEIKNQTIYEKALTAIVMQQHSPKLAQRYAESLKQYTVSSPTLGRYYDTPRASYSWQDYRIPTQTAAIEALHRVTPADTATIREMQLWLVHEKRTQAWQTPLASVNAVHAMLIGNNVPPIASEGTAAINAEKADAMTGYQKRQLTNDEIKTRSISVKKTTPGTSWGAVYTQYWLPLDQVTDQKSGITVKRELSGRLAVGERVRVRLTITAKQDMDFVEVVDRRAACMEPVQQLSGYHAGAYRVQRDCATCYYFDRMSKGKHVIETEYFIDRPGTYQMGSCSAQCAYAPEFRGTAKPITIEAAEQQDKTK